MKRIETRVQAAGGSLTEAVEGGRAVGSRTCQASLVTEEKCQMRQANFNVKGARL